MTGQLFNTNYFYFFKSSQVKNRNVMSVVIGNFLENVFLGSKFHLIMNVAVGGNWGGKQGVDPNIWPQRMEVDYVRVYQ